jgi:hypothetical protein
MTIPTDETELTISAMLPALNSDQKARLVLGRGGFTLSLSSEDMARLVDAVAGLTEQMAKQAEPESPLVDGISTKPLDEDDVEAAH